MRAPRGAVLTSPSLCLSRVLMKSVKATLAGKSRRAWRKQPRLPSSPPSQCLRVGRSWGRLPPSEPSPRWVTGEAPASLALACSESRSQSPRLAQPWTGSTHPRHQVCAPVPAGQPWASESLSAANSPAYVPKQGTFCAQGDRRSRIRSCYLSNLPVAGPSLPTGAPR